MNLRICCAIATTLLISLISFTLNAAPAVDAGTVFREIRGNDSSPQKQEQSELPKPIQQRVIVPLGANEDLPVEVKSVQLIGDLPEGISAEKISNILMEPKAIKKMSELKVVAQNIENYVHEAGFPLFKVIVPDQEIFNGRVRMLIYNGKIDRVVHVLPTDHRMSDDVLQAYFSDLIKTGGFKRLDFERTMLLLNDLPGVKVRLILNPGDEQGLINADLEVIEGKMAKWQFNYDNYGSDLTGKNRGTAILKLNDVTGVGDRLTFMGNITTESVFAGLVEYKRPLGTSGLIGSLSTLYSNFAVTDSLTNIGTKGSSYSYEAGLAYPLLLIFSKNLYVEGSIASRDFTTQTDNLTPQKKNIVVGKLGLRGSFTDASFSGYSATNFGNAYVYKGTATPKDGFTDTNPQDYTKATYGLVRYQALPKGFNLLMSMNGQHSYDVLDSSEKMSLGGATAVRAYDPTAMYSNSAQIYTLELSRDLGNLGDFGIIKSSAFYDHGISFSDDVYGGTNTLKGAGISLALQKWGFYEAKISYARRIGTSTMGTLSDDLTNNGRFWLSFMAFY